MEQSFSWETNRCSAGQVTPCLLCNLMVHNSIQNRLPPVPILIQINPIHTFPSHFLKIHFNNVPRVSVSFPQVFPLKLIRSSLVFHTYNMSRLSLSLLYLITRKTFLRNTDHKSLVILSSPFPVPRPSEAQIFSSVPILEHPQTISLCQCERPSFTPTRKKQTKLQFSYSRQSFSH
jgi:hypothetical protein